MQAVVRSLRTSLDTAARTDILALKLARSVLYRNEVFDDFSAGNEAGKVLLLKKSDCCFYSMKQKTAVLVAAICFELMNLCIKNDDEFCFEIDALCIQNDNLNTNIQGP